MIVKAKNDVRVLLIQVRERVDVEQQEQQCFIERCAIEPEQLEAVNLVREPSPPWSLIDAADVVMIGGAGVFSATEEHPFNDPLTRIVHRLYDEGKPLFGACWGHQYIARALGGTVVTNAADGEVGTREVQLTPAARDDPLFAGMSERFSAHMGHNDHVTVLPEGAVELAFSDRSRNQAFRIAGKPIYGTQFHTELSADRLIERLTIYQQIYVPQDDEFQQLQQNPMPTPEADQILRRFIDIYIRS